MIWLVLVGRFILIAQLVIFFGQLKQSLCVFMIYHFSYFSLFIHTKMFHLFLNYIAFQDLYGYDLHILTIIIEVLRSLESIQEQKQQVLFSDSHSVMLRDLFLHHLFRFFSRPSTKQYQKIL